MTWFQPCTPHPHLLGLDQPEPDRPSVPTQHPTLSCAATHLEVQALAVGLKITVFANLQANSIAK